MGHEILNEFRAVGFLSWRFQEGYWLAVFANVFIVPLFPWNRHKERR